MAKQKQMEIFIKTKGPGTNFELTVPFIEEKEFEDAKKQLFDFYINLERKIAYICPNCKERKKGGQECNCYRKLNKKSRS